jgi:hypothetical protein
VPGMPVVSPERHSHNTFWKRAPATGRRFRAYNLPEPTRFYSWLFLSRRPCSVPVRQCIARRIMKATESPKRAAGATITGAARQPKCWTQSPSTNGPVNCPRLLACCTSPIVGGTACGLGAACGAAA